MPEPLDLSAFEGHTPRLGQNAWRDGGYWIVPFKVEADKYLLQAAPQLLAALRETRKALEECSIDLAGPRLGRARAALALVTDSTEGGGE